MDKIEEIFVPKTITTVDGVMAFIAAEIKRRGGKPDTVRMVDTNQAIPGVQFSDEWPCWTLEFDHQ